MTDLFGDLPAFPPALPDDELRLLAALPERDEVQEIEQQDWAPCTPSVCLPPAFAR
jgi:hypothetical protein